MSALRRDLIVLIILIAIGTLVSAIIDPHELYHDVSRNLEAYEIDNILFFLPLYVALGFAWFAHKRSRDTKRQSAERKRGEDALKQTLQDLKTTQTQLIQAAKLASIGELAAGVAHELNQPLMVIRTTGQFIRRSLGQNDLTTDELMEHLEPIERNTKRMMNIINHLRTFSRQAPGEFSPVDVNKVIEDSLLMVGEQLRIRNIEVKMDLTHDLPKIRGDGNQLEQVFLNLITNGRDAIMEKWLKAQGAGGKTEYEGRIEIITRVSAIGKTDNKSSTYPQAPDSNQDFVETLVKDTGGGIAPENVDKIFDPFFSTKEVGKGTGLGLSIVYGIIKDHQGEIEVADTGPEGTTFKITLPIEGLGN